MTCGILDDDDSSELDNSSESDNSNISDNSNESEDELEIIDLCDDNNEEGQR